MSIDGHESRWAVHLPGGIQVDQRKTAISGGNGSGASQGRVVGGALVGSNYTATTNMSKKSETIRISLLNGNIKELVEAAGGTMVSLQPCRVSEPAECERLVEAAVSRFGRIDVLFNQAAKSHFSPIESFTDEDWAAALLAEDGVLVHPGYFFDMRGGTFLVLSLLPPPETFAAGVSRLLARCEEAPSARGPGTP